MTFLCLLPLARIDFRTQWSNLATASDASEQGGGITVSSSLTGLGVAASNEAARGELQSPSELQGVLAISVFDGLGALRVALDVLNMSVRGYLSIGQDQNCRRVLDSFFPSVLHFERVEEVSPDTVRDWAALFSRTILVLVGCGLPYQGFASMRLGRTEDGCRNLVSHIPRILSLIREGFPWAKVHYLCENVFNLPEQGRAVHTRALNVLPYMLDADQVSFARRERLFWFDWQIPSQTGCFITNPHSSHPTQYGRIRLEANLHSSDFFEPGWKLVSPDRLLPTFTAAEPCSNPKNTPARLQLCSDADLQRWTEDGHKFAPYHYQWKNGLVSTSGSWRLPSVQEREVILGFPQDYTMKVWSKSIRARDLNGYHNVRLTLLAATSSIPVLAFLLQALFYEHGLVPARTIQDIVDLCTPGKAPDLASFLLRRPFRAQCLPGAGQDKTAQIELVRRLSTLVSSKGSDVLLLSNSEPLPSFHRLRTSVPSQLWR